MGAPFLAAFARSGARPTHPMEKLVWGLRKKSPWLRAGSHVCQNQANMGHPKIENECSFRELHFARRGPHMFLNLTHSQRKRMMAVPKTSPLKPTPGLSGPPSGLAADWQTSQHGGKARAQRAFISRLWLSSANSGRDYCRSRNVSSLPAWTRSTPSLCLGAGNG